MPTCSHLDRVRDVTPWTPRGCEECLRTGSGSVHLPLCRTCGHLGCCDSSPNTRATRHYRETAHPIVQSFEPGEAWGWCYVERGYFDSLPDIMDELGKPAPPMR